MQPRLVEQGAATQLRVELPQLRAGPPPVRLEVEGEGITLLSSKPQRIAGVETVWSVRILVSLSVLPGEVPLMLRAVFADGTSVEVNGAITVVPPAEEAAGSFPWPWLAVGVTFAVALAVSVLVLARRRRSAW